MSAVDLAVAQHEAAHVVIGVALGMRLRAAVINAKPKDGVEGWTLFHPHYRERQCLMYAAGIAWERSMGDVGPAAQDRVRLRELGCDRGAIESYTRAASAMLWGLAPAHARVTRALLERNLGAVDVARLARGEPLREPED